MVYSAVSPRLSNHPLSDPTLLLCIIKCLPLQLTTYILCICIFDVSQKLSTRNGLRVELSSPMLFPPHFLVRSFVPHFVLYKSYPGILFRCINARLHTRDNVSSVKAVQLIRKSPRGKRALAFWLRKKVTKSNSSPCGSTKVFDFFISNPKECSRREEIMGVT